MEVPSRASRGAEHEGDRKTRSLRKGATSAPVDSRKFSELIVSRIMRVLTGQQFTSECVEGFRRQREILRIPRPSL